MSLVSNEALHRTPVSSLPNTNIRATSATPWAISAADSVFSRHQVPHQPFIRCYTRPDRKQCHE